MLRRVARAPPLPDTTFGYIWNLINNLLPKSDLKSGVLRGIASETMVCRYHAWTTISFGTQATISTGYGWIST
jgi:hypothetical protein